MTGYKQLTGKYLKASKKRAILTIIGIILSVALICTIGLFFKGIQEAQIQDFKNTYGSWHIGFSKINDNLISKVINNPKVSRYGFFSEGEGVKLGEKLVANEIIATDKALELLPYKTKEGRIPESENEAAVEKWVLSYIDKNAKVGDKFNFNNKEYKLVGILEDSIQNQIENKAVLLTKNNNISKENSTLLLEVSSKTNLKTAVNELKQLGETGKYMTNAYLLMAEGAGDDNSVNTGIYITLSVVIGIVVVSTIAVIYNSFQISIVERIKQFGLLRAVGTTPKQIRKIVLREATVLAVIGIPVGLLLGIIAICGIGFVFKLIGGELVTVMKLVIDPKVIAMSALVGVVSIYLSAIIPAFFAGRISPLTAISSRNSITKEKIKRRKSRVSQRIFGFEGALASKNIKRNRKRYRITVFSILISVVLFITFKSFMDMTLNISEDLNESKNIHFSVITNNQAAKKGLRIDDKTVDNIKALKLVDKLYKVYDPYYFYAAINKDGQIKKVQDIGGIYDKTTLNGSEKTLIRSGVVIYDTNSIEASKKYLQSGTIDIEKLNRENGVVLVKKNIIYDGKSKKNYFGPIANVKVGDEIELQYDNPIEDTQNKLQFGKGNIKKVKVMAIVEKDPFNFRGEQDVLKMLTTEDVAKNLMEKNDVKPTNLYITIKGIKDEEAAKAQIEATVKSNISLSVINNIDNNRKTKSALLMIKILIYGFVVVVSLIGSVNIINTVTTNIILRKREFASLKSIGLTQRGLKKIIILEGLLYAIVGTLYGSIIGSGISFVIYKGLVRVREFSWMVPWNAIAIAGAAAIVIGYISVLSPLSRIKKENLIEAIREDY
ncbi:ABC transporter permease [Clostridium sp. DJ247]|nr:ABC transporter permease [Clostridium sp. DJ247]